MNSLVSSTPAATAASARVLKVFKLMMLVAATFLLAPMSASARTYFISKVAPGPRHDGLTWQTAFTEMNQLDAVYLRPADRVEIDGGATSMVYRTPLSLVGEGTAQYPIIVRNSSQAGRTGQVIIVGDGGWLSKGVTLTGNYIQVLGTRWRAIRVTNFNIGVELTGQGQILKVANMQIDHNRSTGLFMYGDSVIANQLWVHDNYTNIQVSTHNSRIARISRSFIFNGNGDAYNDTGILINNGQGWTPSTTEPVVSVQNCIIGPGLRDNIAGMDLSFLSNAPRVKTTLTVQDCMLLNPHQRNVGTLVKILTSFDHVSSFLTPLNADNQSHSCLDVVSNDTFINNSIFYGGVVNVKFKTLKDGYTADEVAESEILGFRQLGAGNVQFRTSGQTILLSPDQVDPRFVTNVAAYPNTVAPSTLNAIDLRHAVAPTSGSRLTSLRQLVSINTP